MFCNPIERHKKKKKKTAKKTEVSDLIKKQNKTSIYQTSFTPNKLNMYLAMFRFQVP